jgi:dCTP deaminase
MLDSDDNISDSVEVDIDFGQGMDIGPGQFMLAHTLEYIKLPTNVAAQVEGRSSFARIGLQVHMTANLVEAGFDGCLTLEILNSGPSSIRLYPGMRIAQLRFFRLASEPQYPYGHSGENKYRGRLSHNKTRQFSDWETKAIDDAKLRFSIKG